MNVEAKPRRLSLSNVLDHDVMHLSIVSGTVGRAGDPRKIHWAKSPLGQRFDRQLYPASGDIDNPWEN